MILHDYYWHFTSAVSKETCNDIIAMGLEKESHLGMIGAVSDIKDPSKLSDNDVNTIAEFRKSRVSWLNEKWLYEMMQDFVHTANVRAGWNFDWDWSEDLQFTVYEPGHYYHWHADQKSKPYGSEKGDKCSGKVRKISAILSLTDPDTYEGGGLQFDYGNNQIKTCHELRPQGSVVVFPSFVYHRVIPVQKGTRYSLVMWNLGEPFK